MAVPRHPVGGLRGHPRDGGPSTGGAMHAEVGDHIVIETVTLDSPRRHGEVVEVIGQADRRHYRVRWQDGHESVYFPGPDARVTDAPS
jgi:uncharacterized protein DUF1918